MLGPRRQDQSECRRRNREVAVVELQWLWQFTVPCRLQSCMEWTVTDYSLGLYTLCGAVLSSVFWALHSSQASVPWSLFATVGCGRRRHEDLRVPWSFPLHCAGAQHASLWYALTTSKTSKFTAMPRHVSVIKKLLWATCPEALKG